MLSERMNAQAALIRLTGQQWLLLHMRHMLLLSLAQQSRLRMQR